MSPPENFEVIGGQAVFRPVGAMPLAAASIGLTSDVFEAEEAALAWLQQVK